MIDEDEPFIEHEPFWGPTPIRGMVLFILLICFVRSIAFLHHSITHSILLHLNLVH